ncbi:hypothetical protein GTR04_6224 [Trichophyton interdigitale]|uniref:Uncharacterized protein n=1 Tax=Trichophyton interdigitale (strain MR816) TaxID=1215338 RepID=A0A059IZW2_TRIIM|nr:hypothetical protein GY631_5737 [Trichophyton interdigitale]KAG5216491.1 hypothetical protein GY632_7502 [Trichophyton interdigitale]KAG8206387.1 hypothetical protein GTR04_6224 [Trichophyton interdigitale]KDB20772.1 hypothetical protein H109_07279 [Trichophyton interdigitale MR816]
MDGDQLSSVTVLKSLYKIRQGQGQGAGIFAGRNLPCLRSRESSVSHKVRFKALLSADVGVTVYVLSPGQKPAVDAYGVQHRIEASSTRAVQSIIPLLLDAEGWSTNPIRPRLGSTALAVKIL